MQRGSTWWRKEEGASRWSRWEERDGRIGRIENRRAIRETQRKDSITSHKESKPSGEINKRSPPPATTAKGETESRVKTRGENERLGGEGRKEERRERTNYATTCVIEIPSVRSILSCTLTNVPRVFISSLDFSKSHESFRPRSTLGLLKKLFFSI